MLFSLDKSNTLKPVGRIPHAADFARWRGRLTDAEYAAIRTELLTRIGGSEVATSSWIPGSDWNGTVFQRIFDKACGQDFDASARFFGLIVWDVFMQHGDSWCFGRYEKDGIPIRGMTYFRVQP